MATTPNAQLTKLALGIASVAALAAITGRLSGGAAPTVTPPPPAPDAVQAAEPAPAPARTGENRKHDDDDDEWEGEDEDDHGWLLFAPQQPAGSGAQPEQVRPGQHQARPQLRTRSKHS